MGTVLRFPVERTRPAPLYAARLHLADVLVLPTVRIEREDKAEPKSLVSTDASGGQPTSGKRRRTPRQ
ncbi:MAG TPA: hypothetical protein VN930_03005 [Xanthobacteraceae bacterium]|jgi:hypothetical protein|nr:hypothetical protein [Xanthobacteraceae bacterium]